MNIRSKFFGNAGIYLGANILNAGIPFLLLPVLTRVLTPADYGTLAMFGIVLSVVGAFTGLSVHGAIGVRYFQMETAALAEYVGACVGILVVSTSVIFLLVALLGEWLSSVSGVPSDWLLVAVILSGFQFIANIRLSLWQVSGEAMKYGIFQVSQSLTNAAFSLIFILAVGLAWQGRVLGQILAISVFGIISLWWLLKDNLLKNSNNWRRHVLDALNFGVPLIPHVIGGLLISTAGQFIVTNKFGVAKVGLYVVGVQFGSALGIVADAFVKSYGPWLYEKLKDGSNADPHFIVGIVYYVFLSFLLLSVIASIIVFAVFPLIVGERFLAGRSMALFFIFGAGFIGMYYAVAGFFFFTSKTRFVSVVTIFSGVLSIFLMLILGEFFGIMGVASGYLISQIFMFLFAWIISALIYPLPWMQIKSALSAVSMVYLRK